MKRTYSALLVAFLFFAQNAQSQNNSFSGSRGLQTAVGGSNKKPDKPVIDTFAISHCVHLGDDHDISISNDGRYCSFIIENNPFQNHTLVVQSLNNYWKKEFVGASPVLFSGDNKVFVFTSNDSLYFLKVGTDEITSASAFTSFKHPKPNHAGWRYTDGEWLAWQTKSNEDVVLKNLLENTEKRFDSIMDYIFSESGKGLLLKSSNENDDSKKVKLIFFDLIKGKPITVWSSEYSNATLLDYSMDASGTQVVFRTQETTGDRSSNAIWYFSRALNKSVLIANKHTCGIELGFFIDGAPAFIGNDMHIRINLTQEGELPKPDAGAVKVDVWNYREMVLHSAQSPELLPKSYYGVINTRPITSLGSTRIIRLTKIDETLRLTSPGDFAIVSKDPSGDRFWDKKYGKYSNWLVSLKDGSRTLLKTNTQYDLWFSPGGNYLLYFDPGQKCNYFSYDLKTGDLKNISAQVPAYVLGDHDMFRVTPQLPKFNIDIAAWVNGDSNILVYDNYDIWLLSLSGSASPQNITNSYGRRQNIKFRLTTTQSNSISVKEPLLLSAFNASNKLNGFYQKVISEKGNPKFLTMDSCVYSLNGPKLVAPNAMHFNEGSGLNPVKARNADVWIIKKQTFNEAPNLFVTDNFKTYVPLTTLAPDTGYNWLGAELINFTQLDGTKSQGVLYKPENFDPQKKYPVIFNYYEQMSHRLFEFPTPALMWTGNIEVAWFVSRGYLVFTPDIYFKKGEMGQSALSCVEGAVMYLSTLGYVDAKKIGLSGHSKAGGLTNYIVTHSNKFAAAIEGAGTSDRVSDALELTGIEGQARQSRLQLEETYMESNIWNNQKLWLNSSPILSCDKVTSPLLIFHCKADGAVPWSQGVEMFVALRRLDKPVWMLQYDEGDHCLYNKKDCEDLTLRATQFFDHFLKGMPAPVWMTKGVARNLKGIEDGLELESSGKKSY